MGYARQVASCVLTVTGLFSQRLWDSISLLRVLLDGLVLVYT